MVFEASIQIKEIIGCIEDMDGDAHIDQRLRSKNKLLTLNLNEIREI